MGGFVWFVVIKPGLLRRFAPRNDRVGNQTMYKRDPAIYIMANKPNGTLYVGVTSDLLKRVYQHKHEKIEGFTQRYDCKLLVYYEQYEDMQGAITREKQIKGGSRKKKLALIERMNPQWVDLYGSLL